MVDSRCALNGYGNEHFLLLLYIQCIIFPPGQSVTSQRRVSMSPPEQLAPPFARSGLSQRRFRSCTAVPHVALHSDQLPQAPHPPSTVTTKQNVNIQQES